ncbi:uncharacterized protein LOC132206153 [Stegostoma tigrinum]|uniref:uncharacterized protein LOC132206153 n=1 Tax=Stegostoma tigrinum TaxID=3053191 RepID=UPI0028702099|nr:uncharacterized protein LOC132206153 [Stegostoma tigrinum]
MSSQVSPTQCSIRQCKCLPSLILWVGAPSTNHSNQSSINSFFSFLQPVWKHEESHKDFVADCLEFSYKDTVFVKDFNQKLLVVTENERCRKADFRDLIKKEKVDGIKFDVIYYESTNCKTCGFKDIVFPVSFVVQCNSKKYQMSCSESKSIEFLEQNAPEETTVDGSNRNIIFYRQGHKGQFSMFESELARGYWLCTEYENGLYKLALKEVKEEVDERTLLELSPSAEK